jgi:hypothetical protein
LYCCALFALKTKNAINSQKSIDVTKCPLYDEFITRGGETSSQEEQPVRLIGKHRGEANQIPSELKIPSSGRAKEFFLSNSVSIPVFVGFPAYLKGFSAQRTKEGVAFVSYALYRVTFQKVL